ncbi:MAG: glycoside hydrolase family 36 protein [Acidimicrobiia bacterium]
MTETMRTDEVDVVLGDDGTWRAAWTSSGVVLDAGAARIDLTSRDLTSRSADGSWHADGLHARWNPNDDDLWVELDLNADILTVQAGYRAKETETVGLLTPLVAVPELDPQARLVNGYDSWAYAGVVAGDRDGDSWWNTALVDRGGRTLVVQALGAERFATRIVVEEGMLIVECGGTPPLRFVPDTWGYEVLEPAPVALPLAAGEEVRSERVAISAGTDAVALVDRLAARVGANGAARRWAGAPIAGWESWYHYGHAIDAEALLANARLLRERFGGRADIDLVQLDDGWQVAHGAWTPNERFPADLRTLTTSLHQLGARAGLWLAPFMVTPDAPGIATDHRDWCLVHSSGHTLRDRHGLWGLDASHPEALVWLRELGAQVRTWGFEMVKLDFLYIGAQEAIRHDPSVTGTDALRRGLRAFVDGLGDDVYVLGCGMPMLPALGICHGNRIGPDLATPVLHREFGQPLAEGWSGWHGVAVQARNVAARFALHHWFDCDPDVVLAWGSDLSTPDGYSLEESRTFATLAALLGGPYFLADDLGTLAVAEREVLEDPETLALLGGDDLRPVDLFAAPERPEIVHAFATATGIPSHWVARRAGKQLTATFNWRDEPVDGIPARGVRLDQSPRSS